MIVSEVEHLTSNDQWGEAGRRAVGDDLAGLAIVTPGVCGRITGFIIGIVTARKRAHGEAET